MDAGDGGQQRLAGVMSTLINAECRFKNPEKDVVLTGGRSFLDSLVTVVSAYAQEFLSGIYHAAAHPETNSTVSFAKSDLPDRHRLIWQPEADTAGGVATQAVTVDLTTVQLFDLVEAIDQLLTDKHTLPDMTLAIAPVSRRYRQADVPLAQRIAPAAIGISSLAIAAILFSLIPAPKEVKPPQNKIEAVSEEEKLSEATASPPGTEADLEDEDPSTATEDPEDSNATPLSPEELETLLAGASQIEDATELSYLERHLYDTLNQEWEDGDRENLNRNLEYRVSVGRDGAILRYEPIKGTSEDSAEDTPLPGLIYTPTSASQPEEIADFRVVFTDKTVLQVSPWFGYSSTPDLGPEITNKSALRNLNRQLRRTLIAEQGEDATYSRSLAFRVGILEDGTVAYYVAENQAASDFVDETPLPDLVDPEAAGIGKDSRVPQEPLAYFNVVFERNGVVEVSPYRGF